MGQSFSLGRISGIRIGVNWSVLLIVALLAYGLAVGEFPAAAPRHPVAEYVVAALLTAVAYMGSLLAHELAHSLVARRNGLQVEGITLWLLGGVSRLQGEAPNPGAEIRIAGVGPLVSLILGGAFLLLAWLVHAAGVRGVLVVALAWLGGINLLLAVFNVIPAAPLDGGRLLRAVLWRITGDRFKAAVWSARSGQVFGWALIVVAYLVLVRREYNWLWFGLLGWFLISAATAEGQQAMLQGRLRTIAVRDVMTAHPVTVPASSTVAWFLDDYLPWHRHSAFPVEADDGQTVGLVTVHRVSQVPADERGRTMLRDVACALSDVARAAPDEPVADVLPRLHACSDNRALVFADGHLAGIVSPSDISRAMERLSRGPGTLASARS